MGAETPATGATADMGQWVSVDAVADSSKLIGPEITLKSDVEGVSLQHCRYDEVRLASGLEDKH